MLSLRPIAAWTLGAMFLLLSIALAQALMSAIGLLDDQWTLARIWRLEEQWLERGYDWSSIPFACLVSGEGLLAIWLLGTSSRIIPRDEAPILAYAGVGLILVSLALYAFQRLGLWGTA